MTTRAECDSCGHEMDGYSRRELEAEGWVWHEIKEGVVTRDRFIMCGDCESAYALRRELAKALA